MSSSETELHHRFLRLFTTHEEAVRAFVRRLVPTRADDVMQEVSIVLWEKFRSFQEGADFKAWAFGVAQFEVLFSRSSNPAILTVERCSVMKVLLTNDATTSGNHPRAVVFLD